MIDLSIIIPVYNGSNSIVNLVETLGKLIVNERIEIVLVNDSSKDDSWQKIKSIVPSKTVSLIRINLARNFGEHNAVMAGYAHANGNFIINIDDDFQNPPSEVIKLYEFAKNHPELDVVYTYFENKQHPFLRNIGSQFTNFVAGLVIDKPKDLYLSSFRCINRHTAKTILKYAGPYPYIDGLILQNTSRMGRIRVDHQVRKSGTSGYTLRKLIRLWLAMFLNFSIFPLRFSSMLGFGLSALGLIMTAITIFDRFYSYTPLGWASIMAGLMVFSGAQLIILGIIGEYVGRLYLTANGKPQYNICEIITSTDKS